MNQTINVSLPKALTDLAREKVKEGYYSSISEVIRTALRNHLLTPEIPTFKMSEKAEKRLEKALKEYREGKAIEVKSLSDLHKL